MTEHKHEKVTPMRINANLVVYLIRRDYEDGGEEMALDTAHQCVSNITDEQIMKIARGEATLVGVTPGPVTYQEL